PLHYLGGQFGLLLGFGFVVWAAAMAAYRPGRATPEMSFLWWASAPVFVAFGLFSLTTTVMVNWPVTAYLSGLVLGGGWLGGRPRWAAAAVAVGVGGLAVSLLLHDPRPLRPLMEGLAAAPTEADPCPLRRLDPTCRMRGWRVLAAAVDR